MIKGYLPRVKKDQIKIFHQPESTKLDNSMVSTEDENQFQCLAGECQMEETIILNYMFHMIEDKL